MRYPVHHMLGAQRNGINSAGMELGDFDYSTGPVRGTKYPVYPDALLDWYRTKGVKSVRITFCWEAVQKDAMGDVPTAAPANYQTYWQDLVGLVNRLLARDIYVVLVPWQFNTPKGTTDIVYKDAAFSSEQFADFWGKFARAINTAVTQPARVGFDLINEPHEPHGAPDIGITLDNWFAYAQAAIDAIRENEAQNTIFVPGMNYAAARYFTINGSAAKFLALTDLAQNLAVTVHCYTQGDAQSPTVVKDACAALVTWARANGVKVNVGEIAIDAGPNGQATFGSTFAAAQAQWANWVDFCLENNDVIVGWNWWANGAANWWGVGDSTTGHNWGLTTNNGGSQTVYMNLIEASFPTPLLYLRDNLADSGVEPNSTLTLAYESPDIWVRRTADGGTSGQPVAGLAAAVVYVKVSNRGTAPYPGGKDAIRLFWAKAESGLSWPAPWDGSSAAPSFGGTIANAQTIGPIPAGGSINVAINWPSTPDPAIYPNTDGHFCLLAFIAKPSGPSFDGFEGPNLNTNVLRWSHCAWRNIHISPVGSVPMGSIVLANNTSGTARMQAVLETFDSAGARSSTAGLILVAQGDELRKLTQAANGERLFKDLGHGRFELREADGVMPPITLQPGEKFWCKLLAPAGGAGYAVRVTQYQVDGSAREVVGGQTFVAGAVEGYTQREPTPDQPAGEAWRWWWVIAAVVLLAIIAWWVF